MTSENDRATEAGIANTFVKTGKATAPPPWGVDPATKLPKTIVSAARQLSAIRSRWPPKTTNASHPIVKAAGRPHTSARRNGE